MQKPASMFVQLLRLLSSKQPWSASVRRGAQTQTPRTVKALKRGHTFGESGYPLLVIPVTTFCLGTWQIKRRWWKLDLIKSLEEKTMSPPVSLPSNLEEVSEMEYRPVILRGVFDHSREMIIGPRSNVQKDENFRVHMGNESGANIVTPFKLSDRNETILVNRGWVPSSMINVNTRKAGQVQGEVEVTGIVRLQEKRPPFLIKSDTNSKGYWMYRDLENMAKSANTAPVFVDLNLQSSVPNGPIGGQTRVSLRNEHMTYIITWYSLCAITSYMWFRRYRRPLPPNSVMEYLKKRQQQS